MDFVTAGQAFHWFEPAAARVEFQRILKPAGWVVLIWNERLVTPGFMAEHEDLQNQFAREKPHPGDLGIQCLLRTLELARGADSQSADFR